VELPVSRVSQTWAVARYELTWDLRKKRTYIVVGLFLFAAFVFGYLWPVIWGKSVTKAQLQLGISFGSGLWWVAAVFLVFNAMASGLFPLLIGGLMSADSIASEFDSGTVVPLFSQPVRRVEVYLGKFLAKLLLLLAVSILFTLLVLALSEASVGAQTNLDMFPLVVLAEFGAFLEFAALTFFIGSFSRSGAMVLGVLITILFMIAAVVLVLGLQFGLRESMFFLPAANAGFLFNVIPWYIVQPGGMMVLQGYVVGAGPTVPVAVTVVSALQYVLGGLVVNVVAPLVAGFYLFRRAEVKG
jgi:ABC-type transport system involved in multi-copper enzyme maturation permease subunit